jgi:hypothetical protein
MAELFDFPLPKHRDWKLWEEAVRSSCKDTLFDTEVVEAALPSIKQHWEAIFQEVTVEAPPRAVPGSLTRAQADAIQGIIAASAQAVVERLKHERHRALARLIQVELSLSLCQVRGRSQ